ncbi:MAG: hypothetical protein HRT92_10000 [Piscirickettsiaceae bacterium]|nr:hypothetical protein [Piscirickettsiaceae bacterium]
MKKRKNILQRSSSIIGKACFLLAVLCVVAFYFKVQDLGMQHVISASFLAFSFFLVSVGVVLTVIANTDIPSFKMGPVSITYKGNSEENSSGD